MRSIPPAQLLPEQKKQIPPYGPNKAGEKWGAGCIQVKKGFTELSLSMFNLFCQRLIQF